MGWNFICRNVILYGEDVGQPLMRHFLRNSESLMWKDLSREVTEKPQFGQEDQNLNSLNFHWYWWLIFEVEMFWGKVLFDILPPQIRYGPINFLIAGSKKFLDQLSELPGQQHSWVGWTQLKAFSPNSKLTYWASKAKIWYRAKKRTAWIQLPFGLGEDLVFSLIGICCIFGVLCAVSAR